MSETITLQVGQMVDWPHAPDRLAQIDELRRRKVRIVYRSKSGRLRFPVVPAHRVMVGQICLPGINNPLGRAVLPRSKQYPPPEK